MIIDTIYIVITYPPDGGEAAQCLQEHATLDAAREDAADRINTANPDALMNTLDLPSLRWGGDIESGDDFEAYHHFPQDHPYGPGCGGVDISRVVIEEDTVPCD